MENPIVPQAEPPLKVKSRKQLVTVLLRINIGIMCYLLLCAVHYYLLPMGNVVSGILSFIWELGIFLIAGFVVFSAVFLIIQLFRKDYVYYAVFLLVVVINFFLLFVLPFLVR